MCARVTAHGVIVPHRSCRVVLYGVAVGHTYRSYTFGFVILINQIIRYRNS